MSNRTHEAVFIAKGEKALLVRALKYLIHDQQQMIQEAYLKYHEKRPKVFEDHKQHSLKQINAAENLLDRFRNGSINVNPDEPKGT